VQGHALRLCGDRAAPTRNNFLSFDDSQIPAPPGRDNALEQLLRQVREMVGRWKLLVVALAATLAVAQEASPPAPPEAPAFSQAELDQMLAPIALYPDELLSQILMAATYPLEIVEAARWLNANPGLRGEAAVNAAASETWDPSVKSLLAFPQILSMMDQKLDWTQRLGNAFLAQQQQVMATVQELRRRAYARGSLRSSEREVVEDRDGSIVIAPTVPQVVYVPYYDPFVVYGPWWWPTYPPVYWAPWPGYIVAPWPGFWWGVGVGVSFGFFFGAVDWPHHHVVVVRPPPPVFHPPPGHPSPPPGAWRHDPDHRRNVPYRAEAVRREFGRPIAAPGAPPRFEYRGRVSPGQITVPPPAGKPPSPPAMAGRAPIAPAREPAPHAYEGLRAGGERTREFSARGQASMPPRAAPPPPRAGPAPGAPSAPRSGPAPHAPPARSGAPPGGTGGHR
jgi:hypothetical protein